MVVRQTHGAPYAPLLHAARHAPRSRWQVVRESGGTNSSMSDERPNEPMQPQNDQADVKKPVRFFLGADLVADKDKLTEFLGEVLKK